MRCGIRWGLLLVCCLGWLLTAPWQMTAAQAQGSGNGDTTVSAALADPAIVAGETTQYQVTVTNGSADKPPVAPTIDGLTINYVGPSSQYSINMSNGQFVRSVTVTYVYTVKASRTGTFTIPGQDVDVHGSTLRTLPVTLTVQDPGAPTPTPPGQTLTSQLNIPRKTAYVGESFLVELRAYFGLNVNVLQYAEEPILSGGGFSVGKFTRPRLGVPVVDGVRYRAASYRAAVTGVKTGPVSIGPVDTMPIVQVPRAPSRRGRSQGPGGLFGEDDDDPFDRMFGNGMGTRMEPPQQIKMTAPAVSVEILPLPPGKPDDFSGGIGEFRLEAEVQPRRAQVGDPVSVRLILTGKGNFPRVNAPVLTNDNGLRTYPPTSQFKADDDVGLSGTKTFEQVVVANGPRDSLPAYHLNYLDPATGQYVSLDTPPVAVKIEGTAIATPTVSTAPPAADTPTATPTPTPRPAQDILYIRHDPGPAHSRRRSCPSTGVPCSGGRNWCRWRRCSRRWACSACGRAGATKRRADRRRSCASAANSSAPCARRRPGAAIFTTRRPVWRNSRRLADGRTTDSPPPRSSRLATWTPGPPTPCAKSSTGTTNWPTAAGRRPRRPSRSPNVKPCSPRSKLSEKNA